MSNEDVPFSCIYSKTDWSAGFSCTGETKGASDRYRLPIENSVSSPLCLSTEQQKWAHEKQVPSESILPFNYSRIAMPVLLVLYSIEQYWHEVHPNRWSLEKWLVVLDMGGKYKWTTFHPGPSNRLDQLGRDACGYAEGMLLLAQRSLLWCKQ